MRENKPFFRKFFLLRNLRTLRPSPDDEESELLPNALRKRARSEDYAGEEKRLEKGEPCAGGVYTLEECGVQQQEEAAGGRRITESYLNSPELSSLIEPEKPLSSLNRRTNSERFGHAFRTATHTHKRHQPRKAAATARFDAATPRCTAATSCCASAT